MVYILVVNRSDFTSLAKGVVWWWQEGNRDRCSEGISPCIFMRIAAAFQTPSPFHTLGLLENSQRLSNGSSHMNVRPIGALSGKSFLSFTHDMRAAVNSGEQRPETTINTIKQLSLNLNHCTMYQIDVVFTALHHHQFVSNISESCVQFSAVSLPVRNVPTGAKQRKSKLMLGVTIEFRAPKYVPRWGRRCVAKKRVESAARTSSVPDQRF